MRTRRVSPVSFERDGLRGSACTFHDSKACRLCWRQIFTLTHTKGLVRRTRAQSPVRLFMVLAAILSNGCAQSVPIPPLSEAKKQFQQSRVPSPTAAEVFECNDSDTWWTEHQPSRRVKFENTLRGDINAYFGRKKTDAEASGLASLARGLGRDWIPLATGAEARGERLKKRTICGRVDSFALFEDHHWPSEHDWNVLIDPDPPYRALLHVQDSPGLQFNPNPTACPTFADLRDQASGRGKFAWPTCLTPTPMVIKASTPIADLVGWHTVSSAVGCDDKTQEGLAKCCNPANGDRCLLEAEITPSESLRSAFGQRYADGAKLQGAGLCAYGGWVAESLHFLRPELHPAEAMWWWETAADRVTLNAVVAQDTSGRFDFTDPPGWVTQRYSSRTIPPQHVGDAWVWNVLEGRFTVVVELEEGEHRDLLIQAVTNEALVPLPGAEQNASLAVAGVGSVSVRSSSDSHLTVSIPKACTRERRLRAMVEIGLRIQSADWKEGWHIIGGDDWRKVRRGHSWFTVSYPRHGAN
jgi:hypothetical protein